MLESLDWEICSIYKKTSTVVSFSGVPFSILLVYTFLWVTPGHCSFGPTPEATTGHSLSLPLRVLSSHLCPTQYWSHESCGGCCILHGILSHVHVDARHQSKKGLWWFGVPGRTRKVKSRFKDKFEMLLFSCSWMECHENQLSKDSDDEFREKSIHLRETRESQSKMQIYIETGNHSIWQMNRSKAVLMKGTLKYFFSLSRILTWSGNLEPFPVFRKRKREWPGKSLWEGKQRNI